LQQRCIDVAGHEPAAIGILLAVAGVPAQAGVQESQRGGIGVVEQLGKDLLRIGLARDMAASQVVPLAARAEAEHEVVARVGDREIDPEFDESERVAVAGLVVLVGLGAESEEAARERALVAARRVQAAALLHQDAAARRLLVMDPAAPDEGVVLLTFRRVGEEGPGELLPAPFAKIDVDERDAEARPHVAVIEGEGRDHAAHQEALEDVARLDPPLRDVAPALRVREIVGANDGRNAPSGRCPPRVERGGSAVARDPRVIRVGGAAPPNRAHSTENCDAPHSPHPSCCRRCRGA
jgi:hypothetical protein